MRTPRIEQQSAPEKTKVVEPGTEPPQVSGAGAFFRHLLFVAVLMAGCTTVSNRRDYVEERYQMHQRNQLVNYMHKHRILTNEQMENLSKMSIEEALKFLYVNKRDHMMRDQIASGILSLVKARAWSKESIAAQNAIVFLEKNQLQHEKENQKERKIVTDEQLEEMEGWNIAAQMYELRMNATRHRLVAYMQKLSLLPEEDEVVEINEMGEEVKSLTEAGRLKNSPPRKVVPDLETRLFLYEKDLIKNWKRKNGRPLEPEQEAEWIRLNDARFARHGETESLSLQYLLDLQAKMTHSSHPTAAESVPRSGPTSSSGPNQRARSPHRPDAKESSRPQTSGA